MFAFVIGQLFQYIDGHIDELVNQSNNLTFKIKVFISIPNWKSAA